ncbi:hypothetical protein ACLESO_16050 [Pyxidicoccus sp. 3LG]
MTATPDAGAALAELRARIEQRERVPALEEFLRARFPPPRFRFFSPIRGDSDEERYQAWRLDPFKDRGGLVRSRVFSLGVNGLFLEGRMLPSGGSFGTFAVGPQGFSYLTRQPQAVEALLREESRPLECWMPYVLASLFAGTLGAKGNSRQQVLKSPGSIRTLGWIRHCGRRAYQLDRNEWARVRARVCPPALESEGEAGWRLEFCVIEGWMHEIQRLARWTYLISRDYRLTRKEEVLTRRLFDETPSVRY